MDRAPGPSVRLKLTLSYAGFIMVVGVLLLGAVLVFYLYYLPDGWIHTSTGQLWIDRSLLLAAFAPFMAVVLVFLLISGLLGGSLDRPSAHSRKTSRPRRSDESRTAGPSLYETNLGRPGRW
ncbi:hypothetical protein [Nocardia testacea]|uniref:hypothetical protein n=1 Tax=Nocardia testacea TaxID=248551 RepID=UPI0033CFDE18